MADSGCLRVSQILVNKASGDNVLQVLGNKAQKKLPNRPGFTHVLGGFMEVPRKVSIQVVEVHLSSFRTCSVGRPVKTMLACCLVVCLRPALVKLLTS